MCEKQASSTSTASQQVDSEDSCVHLIQYLGTLDYLHFDPGFLMYLTHCYPDTTEKIWEKQVQVQPWTVAKIP